MQRTRFLRFWAYQFISLIVLWFIFTGQLSWAETGVGIGAAVLAASAAVLVRGKNFGGFQPHAKWLLEAWRLPGSVLSDNWVLATVLLNLICSRRQAAGSFRMIKFRAGGKDNRSAARRALAIMMATISPNSVVIGIDLRRNFMLVHQIRPRDEPEYLRVLGAE